CEAMADNLCKQPRKGILKNSSSFDEKERHRDKAAKWDEMNILATLHPKDKDYGHMKIEEPKTPFAHGNEDGGSGDEEDGLDANELAKKIQLGIASPPRAMKELVESSEEESEESPEEREKRKMFEMKRKQHYNEYMAVKLARKLMENDDEDEDEDEKEKGDSANKECVNEVEGEDEEMMDAKETTSEDTTGDC
ncbi:unnamed protein product, partial [Meganyctiphanes norvegica]